MSFTLYIPQYQFIYSLLIFNFHFTHIPISIYLSVYKFHSILLFLPFTFVTLIPLSDRTPSSAVRVAASVNEPTTRVRCNVCSTSETFNLLVFPQRKTKNCSVFNSLTLPKGKIQILLEKNQNAQFPVSLILPKYKIQIFPVCKTKTPNSRFL